MDVPAPQAGTVKELRVKVGDKVSQGSADPHARGRRGSKAAAPGRARRRGARPQRAGRRARLPRACASRAAAAPAPSARRGRGTPPASAPMPPSSTAEGTPAHASPGVRRFARELGVDLARVTGTGPKARILKEDIQGFVKGALAGGAAAPRAGARGGLAELGLPAWPKVDFAKFGPVEIEAAHAHPEDLRARRSRATG